MTFGNGNGPDASEVSGLLAQNAEAVSRYLLPNGKKKGQYWVTGNIHGDEGESLKVNLAGEKAGVWCDFANPSDTGDLLTLWSMTRKLSMAETLREAREYLGLPRASSARSENRKNKPQEQKDQKRSKKPNQEFLAALKKRLRENSKAMEYLSGRGLSLETVERFGLGLSKPYERKDGTKTSDALVFPVVGVDGGFINRYCYYTVPGVTQNPIDKNGWMAGDPLCYFADSLGAQTCLFVCEGIKDVWRHYQALAQHGLVSRFLVISSTHGSAIPESWRSADFWVRWETIYFGHDNDNAGDAIAERLVEYIGREAHRIKVPKEYGKDWTDFWNNEGTPEAYLRLVEEAVPVSARVEEYTEDLSKTGRFSYDPIDINGAYHNGYLYYPTQTLVREKVVNENDEVEIQEKLEPVVVRSDGTIHRAVKSKAPKGTPTHLHVVRLTDGTLISREPQPNTYGTWEWASIQRYIGGKAAARGIQEIFRDILDILKRAVWLPYEEDYAVLALTVPVTYTQAVFESVPLLLLNGPAGSGKTQTGVAMAKICCNGNVIGQVSAAAAARHIDQCKGFVVMDDLEGIASKSSKDSQFNELVQALKVSYNKHSAIKIWIDVKTMKSEKLNFFGVKMINNTLGADSILGSRMVRIQTRKMPDGVGGKTRDISSDEDREMRRLRNELHVWAFQNVGKVDAEYKKGYAMKSDRAEEIAAPLRVMAALVGDPEVGEQLERALARQVTRNIETDDPVETLKEALKNLIVQGYGIATLTHISLEMRSLLDANFGRGATTEIPEWMRPEWIGRQLRSHDLVTNEDLGRKRFFGKNLRLVGFSEWFIDEVAGSAAHIKANTRQPGDFCMACEGCRYRNAGCELMPLRQNATTH